MKQRYTIIAFLLLGLLLIPIANVHAQTEQPVVRAVLFYSPTCGHCEFVINETILPMIAEYGDQLQVIGVDVTQPEGQQLFLVALEKFGVERGGVPFLVMDNFYLVGSGDIPAQFPGLVESYLEKGGLDWPQLPGLEAVLPAPQSDPQPAASSSSPTHPTTEQTWRERFANDPAGNTLAVIVLVAMLAALGWTFVLFRRDSISTSHNLGWLIPALSVIGIGVAGYLAYVEMFEVTAVCGPVGDCNTVQQSSYARLFGILPIGVLGLIGYVAIILSWLASRYFKNLVDLASLSLFGMTVFGTLFSVYLTFLEPFVIGATCAWCLTSAVLITVLLLLTARPAKLAFQRMSR